MQPLNDVTFIDSNNGWAVGDSGTILHTSDGGNNWEFQESGTIADLNSVFFVDENYGWICGDSSIILHTDNGGVSDHCLPEGITFTTQEQIDNFQTDYPGCTEIEGDVFIGAWEPMSNISNLNGLNVLTTIGGNLNIEGSDALSSLTGLGNLTSIGGYLNIFGNDSLTSLTSLESLTYVEGLIIGIN
ncbi:MAG: YCF48-related protein, partial [Bacteroidales bacterium]|nr:YCF48-related protein [Bacteroidales bacterium]